jgi:hypothetical protein
MEVRKIFEQVMHNVLMSVFPACKIDCCRFHLAQSWSRKIQTVGLSSEYKDKSCEIGKWLSQFFGLPFLPAEEIEDCFVSISHLWLVEEHREEEHSCRFSM